jgi:integrase
MPVRVRSGTIHLDFRYKGQRLRPTTGLAVSPQNLKLAERWLAEIQFQVSLGTFRVQNHFPHYRHNGPAKKEGRFATAASEWLEGHKQSWAEWTYTKFKQSLDGRIIPKIGNKRIDEITAKDLRVLREAIIAEGKIKGGKLANRSVNRIIQPVKAMFNELHADGEIETNPATRLGKLKEKRIAEIHPFGMAERKALLEKIHQCYQPLARFLFESGFRLNEAFGLKWKNVNLLSGFLSVRKGHVRGKDKDPKTEVAIRDVEITPGMMEALKQQKRFSFLAGEYVFVTETGAVLDVNNFRRRVWIPALKKAELDYRYPYQCRHTFATQMIEENRNPMWIANQMGTSLEMLFSTYAVYFKKRGWSQCDQTQDLSTLKTTKMDR